MFDRTAITQGRSIQEFGLCDLKGVYQNTAKLRTKGWLVFGFFHPGDGYSAAVTATLGKWAAELAADRVTVLGIASGDRTELVKAVTSSEIAFPVLWDADDYVAKLFAINALPTVFVTDARGIVLAKIVGDDQAALAAARDQVAAGIQKAIEAAAAAKAAEEAAKAAAAAAHSAPLHSPPPVPVPAQVAPAAEVKAEAAPAPADKVPKAAKVPKEPKDTKKKSPKKP